jgi:hypothetical protein
MIPHETQRLLTIHNRVRGTFSVFILRTNSSICGRIYGRKMALPCRRVFPFLSLLGKGMERLHNRTKLISYRVVGQNNNFRIV